MTATANTQQPFLMRYATARSGGQATPGRYSAEVDVWVVDTTDGERPIVEVADGSFAETQTKTMVHQEADDDDYGHSAAMETATFTRVLQEADDEDATLCLPELMTKTAVQQESDDDTNALI